jgi:hypothetical protein
MHTSGTIEPEKGVASMLTISQIKINIQRKIFQLNSFLGLKVELLM